MSYLNIPRLHFCGRFQADPSTVNNNDNNWNPQIQLSNNPNAPGYVYWNPNGTHNWKPIDCTIRGAVGSSGVYTTPAGDPVIGAEVISAGRYPAKIVDLDPDDQMISQIWGLQLQVRIPDPSDATKTLASVTGTLAPCAFSDLWPRGQNSPGGIGALSASFQGQLQSVTWVNAAASPLLTQLQSISPTALSVRLLVDSFQGSSNDQYFTLGRLVGSIGPVLATDAPRSTPRRLAPANSYGAVNAAWDATRSVMILDLGNCVPTNATPPTSGPSIPLAGWPIAEQKFQLNIPGPTVSPRALMAAKSAAPVASGMGAPTNLGTIDFTQSTYTTFAGVVEVSVNAANAALLAQQPMTLLALPTTATGTAVAAAQEDAQGRYVDVDLPFLRLDPNTPGANTAQVNLWATLFGAPWSGAELPVQIPPPMQALNGGPWNNGSPRGALTLSTATVTTGANGSGPLTLTASDPGTPRMYPPPAGSTGIPATPGPDGQVYWVTGPWQAWGQIFLATPGAFNVLIFSGYTAPAAPTWWTDVEPILGNYARMYPYMKSIIDLGDYATVQQNAQAIQAVLNLPATHPHHMPIVRDLSPAKLAMINTWFNNGMPEGTKPTAPAAPVAPAAPAAPAIIASTSSAHSPAAPSASPSATPHPTLPTTRRPA